MRSTGARGLVRAAGRLRGLRHRGRVVAGWARRRGGLGPDAGMATAEYAIVTLAAVGFAGILLVVLKSEQVRSLLLGIVRAALAS